MDDKSQNTTVKALRAELIEMKKKLQALASKRSPNANPVKIPAAENKKSKRFDVLKTLGSLTALLVVFIPVMTAILQYRQSLQQDLDKSFRSVITDLSSQDNEKRIAAASNMGTFMKPGQEYYEQATDILVNRLSTELDYNVLNAIRGSLEKIEKEDYEKVIEKLLRIERLAFIQEYELQNRSEEAEKRYIQSEENYSNIVKVNKLNNGLETPNEILKLDILRKDLERKWETFYKRESEFSELRMHKQVIADFLSIFLGITKTYPLKKLELFRNSLNFVVIIDLNLSNAHIDLSSLSSSTIKDTEFDGSTIIDTYFSYSTLTNSSFKNCTVTSSLFDQADLSNVDFSGCEFTAVYFTSSDLANANFENAKGLKPVYFFGAKNIDKAKFDSNFQKELDDTLESLTLEDFKEYLENDPDLERTKKSSLLKDLNKLNLGEPLLEDHKFSDK